ncbi:MAG TPA: formylglycine-generating enzyme family protein, partial [Longimicrobiales bacterium]|nr:formylglycine-generating enzyme family protein [Longimicrobiales bacterium]
MTFRNRMIRRTAFPAILLALLLVPMLSGGSASQWDPARDQDDRFSSGPLEGMRFSGIPPGRFVMGSPVEEKGRNDAGGVEEGPEHPVTLSGFEIMTTEVTQGMWLEVMGATVVDQRDRADPEWDLHGVGPAYPIYYVSKLQAEAFADELNRRDPGRGYRLPTEAEWEHACRAGTTTRFFWGEDPDNSQMPDYGWIALTVEGTSYPVGQKAPNAWGLHDMLGNVFEWVGDWRAPYAPEAQTDPTGPTTGTMGLIRGGDRYHDDQTGRCAARANSHPQNARYTSGFRLVRDAGGASRGGAQAIPS